MLAKRVDALQVPGLFRRSAGAGAGEATRPALDRLGRQPWKKDGGIRLFAGTLSGRIARL